MERYTEIPVVEVLDFVNKKDTKNIYFQSQTGDIHPLDRYEVRIDTVHKKKWFKREVIE